MLKNKYQRLSREERKKARESFFETKFGALQKMRLTRVLFAGIILFLYATYLTIDGIIAGSSIWRYIIAGLLYLFALVFFIGRHKVIVKNVNNHLLKK